MTGFVPPPYPYDRLGRDRRDRRGARRRRGRPVDRHAVRPAAGRGDGGARLDAARLAATRRRSARRRSGEAAARLDRAPARAPPSTRTPSSPPASGTQGVRRVRAAVPEAARPVARHGPLPGDQLPDLRDGRDAGRAAGRCLRDARRHQRGRRRAGAVPLGQLAGNPTGELRDLAAAAAWGARAGRPGPLRRVLRRVHLGRPADDDPARRDGRASSRCTRCPSATTSPAPGSASTPATPSWCTTCARCASTPV